MDEKKLRSIFVLIVLSFIFFMLGNNILSLTNPDEVFYTLTAKEMVAHNTWMTPYIFGSPQFEKPVLLYWFLRTADIFFGFTNFSMRFFPALFGIFGVLAVYFLCLIGFKNERKAFICSLILMSSGLYIGMARTVFTDLIFSVFILLALAFFYWGYTFKEKKAAGIILFFVFTALAVLAKGPLGVLITFLTVFIFLLAKRELSFIRSAPFFWGFLIFLAISLPWYIFMEAKYGAAFNREFFYNDHFRRLIEAEHSSNDRWYFYPLSMIGCMFPWSLYLLAGLFYSLKSIKRSANPIYLFMFIWLAVVFLIFEPAHSKLVSYILPLFPVLAMICGDYLYSAALNEARNKALFIVNLVTLSVILIFPIGLIAASRIFSVYLSSTVPVYVFSLAFVILAAWFAFFIFKAKISKIIFPLIFVVPLMVFSAFALQKDVEPYVSSKNICAYLKENYPIEGSIICSKFFVRG
ncbi:MAG: glycosyltransferase family 39 protein, partial [Candidatus Omnitrophota bacterium]